MIADRVLDPVVRERLFSVAREAFARHGYDKASLNAILAAAGLGKSSFFYYFHDKEDLFATLVEDAIQRLFSAAGPLSLPETAVDFWPTLHALAHRWVELSAADAGLVGLMRALQPLRRRPTPRLSGALEQVRGLYRPILTRGVALGVVRDDLDVELMVRLVEAVDVVLDDDYLRAATFEVGELHRHSERMMDIVRRIVERRPAPEEGPR